MNVPNLVVCHAARRVAAFASMHLRQRNSGVPATLCGILARQDCPHFCPDHFGITEPPFRRTDWCKTCARAAHRLARQFELAEINQATNVQKQAARM